MTEMMGGKEYIEGPKAIPSKHSGLWNDMVKFRLRMGYGIEDIALQLRCSADDVRFLVRKIRANGELASLYPKPTPTPAPAHSLDL